MPHRSPIIFWLLLAATLSVDAIALYWVTFSSEPAPEPFAVVFYDSLAVGQLSAICVWSALRVQESWWSRLAPAVAVLLASLLIGLIGHPPLTVGLPYYGLHAAMLLALLWLVKRTKFWRRRSGTTTRWRFSIAHLLILTTVVAVLAAALRNSRLVEDETWPNLLFASYAVAVAVVAVIVWSLDRYWLIRLAGVLGFAMVLDYHFLSVFTLIAPPLIVIVVPPPYLIQAAVLSAWLGLGSILPLSVTSAPLAPESENGEGEECGGNGRRLGCDSHGGGA